MYRFLVLLFALLLPLQSVKAAPGELDTSFGTGGIATIDVGSVLDHVTAIAIQPDGKILATGMTAVGGANLDFALVRLNLDGSPDDTFGSGGIQKTDFGNLFDIPLAIAVHEDGKIVVAGLTSPSLANNSRDVAVAQYLSSGLPDNDFDGDGKIIHAFSTRDDVASTVLVVEGGKIILAGSMEDSSGDSEFGVFRLDGTGAIDTNFATPDGGFLADFEGGSDLLFDGKVLEDGSLLFAGTTDRGATQTDFALLKVTAEGLPDGGFDGDGEAAADLGSAFQVGGGLAVRDDGKAIVSGGSGAGSVSEMAMTRFDANGLVDTDFAFSGFSTNPLDAVRSELAVHADLQSDGKILTTGISFDPADPGALADVIAVRFSSNGLLDTSFGVGGVTTISAAFSPVLANFGVASLIGTAVQGDGKLVVGASSGDESSRDFLIARLEGDPDVCGDGLLGVTEDCDDGNATIGDGCDDSCQIEEDGGESGGVDDNAESGGGCSLVL